MKRIATLLPAALLATLAAAQGALHVKETKLSNGLTVWINEDHTQPKVIGAVVVKAGAKDCPGTGIAHYFEHILFKGTDKIGTTDYAAEKPWLDSIAARYDALAAEKDALRRQDIQRDINRLSQKAGEYAIPNEFNNLISRFGGTGLNAFTSFDETVFINTFTPQYVAQWAELNSERLVSPVFRLFQGELETVYEEKNMYSDNMLAGALEAVQARVFAGTPYASPILGTTESLKNPRLSEMKDFYDKYYVAGNMGLMLCGDVSADSVVPLLERTFGRIRPGEAPPSAPFAPEEFRPGDELKVKLPIPVVKAEGFLYRAPTDRDADNAAFELAVALLSNDAETGLLDSLANDYRLMMAIADKVDAFKELGLAGVGYVPNLPFGTKRKARKRCLEQVERIKEGGFSDAALEALKTEKLRQAERSFEDLEQRAYLMVGAFSHGCPWDYVLQKRDRIKAATRADVMAAARKYFDTERRLRLVKKFGKYPKEKVAQPGYVPVTPKHPGAKSAYAEALERMPVAESAPELVDFGRDATTVRLNGLATLYAVDNLLNDIFELQLIYHKGTLADPKLAAVAEYVLSIGTDSLSKQALGRELQAIGAAVDVKAGKTAFTITLSGFDDKLQPALRLLRQLMDQTKPSRKMFRNLVSMEKIADKAFLQEPASIATAICEMLAYGQASAYLNRLTPSGLKAMDGGQLVDLFRQVQENELSIVYSGRLAPAEVEATLRRHVPIERVERPQADASRRLRACPEPAVYLFDFPEARQTVVGAYLQLPAAPDSATRARQRLWSEYFGGGMSSLLFQDIREFRSLAYYAYGQLLPAPHRHPDWPTGYVALLGTQSDKAMSALGVLDSLFRAMPLREGNIAAAKRGIMNSVHNDRPAFRDMGRTIALWRASGYGDDPRRPLTECLPAMGTADVEAYYSGSVKPMSRAIIIVGDKRKLDMGRLKAYGRVVELKREEFF